MRTCSLGTVPLRPGGGIAAPAFLPHLGVSFLLDDGRSYGFVFGRLSCGVRQNVGCGEATTGGMRRIQDFPCLLRVLGTVTSMEPEESQPSKRQRIFSV